MAVAAVEVLAWTQLLGAFLAGVGATWYLLKGFAPDTRRRDVLGRFQVRAEGEGGRRK